MTLPHAAWSEQTPDPADYKIHAAEYLADYADAAPPPASARGNAVAIPFFIRGPRSPTQGPLRWLRVNFQASSAPGARYGITLLNARPNAAVYLNGSYLGASESFQNSSTDGWNYPSHFTLPPALLHEGQNQILIEIRAYSTGLTELGSVAIGPEATLYPSYQRQLWLQVIGVEVVTVLIGLIGVFAAMLWWRRRRDVIFGLFALNCALWIVRNSQFFLLNTHMSPVYFSVVTDAVLFWEVAVLYTLSLRILDRRFPRLEACLFGYALLVTVAMWLGGPSHKALVTSVAYMILQPPSLVFFVYLTWHTWRRRSVLLWMLWISSTVSSLTGLRDLLLLMGILSWPDAYLMPYTALLFAATVGWALVDRFVLAHDAYERLNAELDARVKTREQELATHYVRAASLERERAIETERARILRDIHDGLGLQLISSMRLIEKGELSKEQTSALLAEAMDELRIAIDAIKPTDPDLLMMLGNLRYRLEPRLNSAGITLNWEVAEVSGLDRLSANQVTESTRIVQEAFTNAMKHSQATRMCVRVEAAADDGVQISIIDYGRGFAIDEGSHGEGLRNMRQRASKIGATLDIRSASGETCVVLSLSPTGT
jgi:signal transduction histidine kinase